MAIGTHTMANLRGVIKRYDIEVNSSASFAIDSDGRVFSSGSTHINRNITIKPHTFEREEDLARTLYHENFHVGQINQYGPLRWRALNFFSRDGDEEARKEVFRLRSAWEDEAHKAEREYWDNHPLNPANLAPS